MTEKLLLLSKRIQALAENGIHYAESDYDLDRYTDLKQISEEMMSIISTESLETVQLNITEKVGYRTPKVDIRAVIFNEKDEILMVKEVADNNWSLPGGWADVGFTPAEIAVKETKEEAGLEVEAHKLLAIFDKKCHPHPPDLYYAYKVFIECKIISGELKTGYETLNAGFFSIDNLPELSTPRNTLDQIQLMFSYHLKEVNWPYINL